MFNTKNFDMKTQRTLVVLTMLSLVMGNAQNVSIPKYAKENSKSKIIKLENGNWFNGETFEEKTVLVKDGLLHFKSVEKEIDTTINLLGNYVIPPFAEAHNHNLESSYNLEDRIASYLNNGVFYVKLASTIKKVIQPLMHHYNKPSGIDISMALAPLTATGGHPISLRQYFLEKGFFDGVFESLEEIEFHGYVKLDNLEEINQKWNKILSFEPDFIKLNLFHSEEYEKRKNDSTYFGKKGINPELIPEIVKRAHEANLRVTAHVETANDFHIAVSSGVDEIGHLPEIFNGQSIRDEDVLLAKENGVTVVTTISLVLKKKGQPNFEQLLSNVSNNLKKLKNANVNIAVGSDMYNDNSVDEFKLLNELKVFSNLELLKMWTENASKTIFPSRKIGYLKEGFEASFLVLDIDPLEDISKINEHIVLRIKQGTILD